MLEPCPYTRPDTASSSPDRNHKVLDAQQIMHEGGCQGRLAGAVRAGQDHAIRHGKSVAVSASRGRDVRTPCASGEGQVDRAGGHAQQVGLAMQCVNTVTRTQLTVPNTMSLDHHSSHDSDV